MSTTTTTTETATTATDGEQELFVSIVGGLVGSSCCIVQLLLNFLFEMNVILPFGCAGFNTFLGPLRMYVRTATIMYFLYKFFFAQKKNKCCSKRRLGAYLVLCMSLMFLPEALRLSSRMSNNSAGAAVAAIAPSVTNGAAIETLVFTVDDMGCEACETYVSRIVESFDGVIQVKSIDYETGSLAMEVNRHWNFDEDRLAAKLETKGYGLLPAGSITKKMKMDAQWETESKVGEFMKEDL